MRASDRAYEMLRQDIVEWRRKPGDVLAEVDLSEQLGVSRTPIREAISRLVSDGLATALRGRSTVVSDVSVEHLEDVFVLRRALECEAARLAAQAENRNIFGDLAQEFWHAAATGFTQLSDSTPPETDAYYGRVAELDDQIVLAANNTYLATALRTLRVHLQRLRRLAQDHPQRLTESAREHALIAEAIYSGEPQVAVAATTLHLHQALQHMTTHGVALKGQL